MNKAELIDAISTATDLPKATAARALDAFTASVTTALQQGNDVSLVGFGTFTVKARAAREGRNPQTGAALHYRAVAFRYDKLKRNYESMVAMACGFLWLPM
ncbi:transcriptional regulator HU subunit alpha (plasmid) [Azotobacter chroococcum]|nr:HU family DNA-binding protein [Azotobacter chroococcum]ASL29086.1 transcriptional regulator HU subunit alpha [Azotobacter chroococcum]